MSRREFINIQLYYLLHGFPQLQQNIWCIITIHIFFNSRLALFYALWLKELHKYG